MTNILPTGSTAITDPANSTHQMAVNADGSINVTTINAGVSDVVASGNLTASSGAGSTVQIQFGSGQSTWEAQFTGTFSSGTTIVFEGSDDASSPTNWKSAIGYDSSLTNPTPITSIGGGSSFIIRGMASGYQFFRVRCSAITGGDNVAVRIIGSAGALGIGGPITASNGSFATGFSADITNILSQDTSIATNTNNINTHVAAIDSHTPSFGQATMSASVPVVMASDQSNVPVKGGFTEQASLAAGSLNADLVASTDVSVYKWWSLQITGTYSGTLSFQGSNDNTNFFSIQANLTSTVITITPTTNGTGIYVGPVTFRYLRVRMTSYTSGTANGTLELYTIAPPYTFTTSSTPGGTFSVWRAMITLLNQASSAQTANGNTADLNVANYTEASLDINISANSGTSQTIQFFLDRKGADGIYYNIWSSASITTVNQAISTSFGAGMTVAQSLGNTIRLRWVIGGTTPSYTFSASIYGK